MSGGYGAVINYSDENEQFIDDEEINNAEEQTSQKPTLLQEMVAECIGTCILTQVGCAGLCASTYIGAYDGLWQAAIVWLLGAALAISATASISGAHLNPAVTVSSFLFMFIILSFFMIIILCVYPV
jgi:glycerol uptake facilitator-like aquaporin